MKHQIKSLFFCLLAIFCFHSSSAQEELTGTKQRLEIFLDELGNGNVSLKMKLNAMQWDMFKRTIGNNPAYLKREMIKGMPKFYLTDFKYEEDQMDRSYTFSMKALAAAKVDAKGRWKAELDSKDPDITKMNEREFRLTTNYLTNGALIEQAQIIMLPENAKSSKIVKDSFGKAVLTYEMGTDFITLALKIAGIMFVLGGVAVMLFGARLRG